MADTAVATFKMWKVKDRQSDKHPLLTGSFTATVDIRAGQKLRVAQWNGKDDDGTYTLSGKVSAPQQQHERPPERRAPPPSDDGLDDEIPY